LTDPRRWEKWSGVFHDMSKVYIHLYPRTDHAVLGAQTMFGCAWYLKGTYTGTANMHTPVQVRDLSHFQLVAISATEIM